MCPHDIADIVNNKNYLCEGELRVYNWIYRWSIGVGRYSFTRDFHLDGIVDFTGITNKKLIRKHIKSLADKNIIKIYPHTRTVKGKCESYIPNDTMTVKFILDTSKWRIKDSQGCVVDTEELGKDYPDDWPEEMIELAEV